MTNRQEKTVYFARVGPYVKIGSTINVPQRLSSICAPSATYTTPDDLPHGVRPELLGTLPGGADLELDIQCDLWEWRVVGEWFDAAPELIERIERLVADSGRRLTLREGVEALANAWGGNSYSKQLRRLLEAAETGRMSVHNHPPYRPVCNERRLPDGQLRGACLNDDATPATDPPSER